MIQAVLMVTMGAGKRVLLSEPTFMLYRQVATVLDGEVETVFLTPDLKYDSDALLNHIETQQPDVTIICSPNNPTGCVIDEHALRSILTASKLDSRKSRVATSIRCPVICPACSLVGRPLCRRTVFAGLALVTFIWLLLSGHSPR